MKRLFTPIRILFFTLLASCLQAQEQSGFYLPYQMPTHAFVRFNTFVANPAFPLIVNYQEHNVGLYYRSQWTGYTDSNFSLMGLSYGYNWKEINTVNAFLYKQNASIMTNYGVVLGYGHLVEISDQFKIHMGLNVIPTFSGLDKGRIRVADPNDPLLNVGNSFGINIQPGVNIALGNFHFGGTAENLIDYSLGAKKAMTGFRDKTFTAHLMYREPLDSRNDLLENGYWSVMLKGTKEYDGLNFGGGALFDLPALGWVNLGYTQRNGLLAAVGVNIRQQWSIGIEYENPIGVKVPQLGNTFGVYLNMQFGGERQKRTPPPTPKPPRPKPIPVPVDTLPKSKPLPPPPPPKTDEDLQKDNTIPNRPVDKKIEKIDGVVKGHYVIIGVYANPKNAFDFKQRMSKRYTIGSFVKPQNSYTYVYLGAGAMSLEEAQKVMMQNALKPDFYSGIWVLEVK